MDERDKPSEHDEGRERQDFFVKAPLRAATRLQGKLPITEVSYRRVVGHIHSDARAYYVYGALDEVMKASLAAFRWFDLLGDGSEPTPAPVAAPEDAVAVGTPVKPQPDEHLDRVLFESVIDEQEMWDRKLTEILIDLVLFTSTNDQEFYRLYLICKQLDAYVGLQADFDEFFGCKSENAESTIARLLKDIDALRQRLDVRKAWFLSDRADLGRRPAPGMLFRSVRQRFIRAQGVAAIETRLVLGASYEMGYSSPSRSVHPNVGGPTHEFTRGEIERNLEKVGLLGLHIVRLGHQLSGVDPEGESKSLMDALNASDGPAIFQRLFQRELEVGDIVFAYGTDLCQIIATTKSKYGNTSYKVKYLVRPMLEGVDEDWFPARYIRLLYRRRDIKPNMLQAARRSGSTDEQLKTFEQLDDEGAARILAKTFTDFDRMGVLAMMLRAPKEERG